MLVDDFIFNNIFSAQQNVVIMCTIIHHEFKPEEAHQPFLLLHQNNVNYLHGHSHMKAMCPSTLTAVKSKGRHQTNLSLLLFEGAV